MENPSLEKNHEAIEKNFNIWKNSSKTSYNFWNLSLLTRNPRMKHVNTPQNPTTNADTVRIQSNA